ncbi:MAG: redoxin domain-containing protein [Bacteroidia bacterium]|jgi:peroxiredoxin|nr:redoxin domain-containing protein [Bacteroidia bacterium]
MTIQKGDKAPSFNLFNTEKKQVSLADFQGKNLVVHFFPLAFTGVCTIQLCTVRDAITMYKNDKADVVAISVDSLFTLGKFKEEQHLPFDLLSDFNREAATAYGALHEVFPAFGMQGVAKRAAFVVDKNGVIQYAQVLESPGDLPDFKAIDETLAGLN